MYIKTTSQYNNISFVRVYGACVRYVSRAKGHTCQKRAAMALSTRAIGLKCHLHYYPPYRTLVWKGIFFLCLVTDISATVAPIGMKVCLMVHIDPGQNFSPLGWYPRYPTNPKFWA